MLNVLVREYLEISGKGSETEIGGSETDKDRLRQPTLPKQ